MGVIMSTKQPRSSKFKLKIALAALQCNSTISEICTQYSIAQSQVHKWKKQLQEDGEHVFSKPKSASTSNKSHEQDLAKLYEKIGQLTIERDFLKKSLGE